MADEKEILDLVDSDDKMIGIIARPDVNSLSPGGGKYVRAINAFIIRRDGKIWTPVRSMHKSLAPGGLDYSVGGHVESGEDYPDTLIREFREEAGLTINPGDCIEITYFSPEQTDTRYFSKLYLVYTDQTPRLSDEHTSGEFRSLDDLVQSVKLGAVVKHSYLHDLSALKDYLSTSNRPMPTG